MKLKQIHLERGLATARITPAILSVFATAFGVSPAFAAGGSGTTHTAILNESCNSLQTIKTWLFTIVYVLGAIGMVLIAVSAFLGKFKFAHLISLGGGLFIVAAADMFISFVTDGSDSGTCTV